MMDQAEIKKHFLNKIYFYWEKLVFPESRTATTTRDQNLSDEIDENRATHKAE